MSTQLTEVELFLQGELIKVSEQKRIALTVKEINNSKLDEVIKLKLIFEYTKYNIYLEGV